MANIENVKDILEKLYKRVNPDNIDYNLNENQDANKIREIRNALYEEADKYDKMLDELIMKAHNVDIYMNQYICILSEDEFTYMYVNKMDRLNYSVRFHGPTFESYSMGMSIIHESSAAVYYKDVKTRVKIITKEEFYKELDNVIASNKELLKRNSQVIENKDTINVVE